MLDSMLEIMQAAEEAQLPFWEVVLKTDMDERQVEGENAEATRWQIRRAMDVVIQAFDKQLDRERSIIYYLLDLDFKMEEFEAYSYMYFQIPSEFEATKWAVNYYLSHKEFCDNFLKEIGYAA